MKTSKLLLLLLLASASLPLAAQDANIQQITSDARNVDRTPDGDRSHYGLWAKDVMRDVQKPKPKYESARDSLRQQSEFVRLCGIAFIAYGEKDYRKTVVYGDSALCTGFDNQMIYCYMADSYEQLGDYKLAEQSYKAAKAHGIPHGKELLAAFRKRMKARERR